MRFAIITILIAILGVVWIQAYFILKERNELKAEVADLNRRLEAISLENENLKSEIEYFSRPENLEKELRAKFNYRAPDEKMIIIVP